MSRYIGEKTVSNIHEPSKNEITTTAPVDNGGTGRYFSPTDLLACSFGCCALTIMGNAANSMGVDFSGSSVTIEKIMASNPRKVERLVAAFVLDGEYTDEQKKDIEAAAYSSPVALTLKGSVKLEFSFTYGRK